MFKIEKPEYIHKTFRFEKTFLTEVEIFAQKNNVSTNAFIVQCIRYAISNMEDEDKFV